MVNLRDDDRFFDILNRSGDTTRQYQDKVAEDQAATTRELGQIYSNAISGTVKGAMQGADWRMKRAEDQQKMDLASSKEGRESAEEGRKVTSFGQSQEDRKREQDYLDAGSEEAYARGAGVDYQPGMTHRDVQRLAQGNKLGFDDRKLSQENDIASNVQEGENSRSASSQKAAMERALAEINAANTRSDNTLAFDREKLTADNAARVAAENAKPATDAQLQSASFGRRAQDALSTIDQLESGGYKSADRIAKAQMELPLVGGHPLANKDDQAYEQGKKEFIAALLRKESGGQISTSEYNDYGKIYFPERGEDPQSSALKAARRKAVANNLVLMAGSKAAGQIPNQNFTLAPPKKAGGSAAYADDNSNLTPQELQDRMTSAANSPGYNMAPKKKPVSDMSDDEVVEAYKKLKGGK